MDTISAMIAAPLNRLAWNVYQRSRTKPWQGLDDFDRFDAGLRRRIAQRERVAGALQRTFAAPPR